MRENSSVLLRSVMAKARVRTTMHQVRDTTGQKGMHGKEIVMEKQKGLDTYVAKIDI